VHPDAPTHRVIVPPLPLAPGTPWHRTPKNRPVSRSQVGTETARPVPVAQRPEPGTRPPAPGPPSSPPHGTRPADRLGFGPWGEVGCALNRKAPRKNTPRSEGRPSRGLASCGTGALFAFWIQDGSTLGGWGQTQSWGIVGARGQRGGSSGCRVVGLRPGLGVGCWGATYTYHWAQGKRVCG
jgi:hypothetical protein